MKAILVDFDTQRLEKLEQMKSTTALPRNELIRLAVDFYFTHPDEWANNTYQKQSISQTDCTTNEPPAGTA